MHTGGKIKIDEDFNINSNKFSKLTMNNNNHK